MRVVLDTNTVLSASLFASGRLTWIRDGWAAGRFVPLCSLATIEELIRALAYPKFKLDEDDIRTLVGSYLRHVEVIHIDVADLEALPTCRDPNDQMFLELAACGNADALVTGDDDILELADECDLVIESPAAFKRRLSK